MKETINIYNHFHNGDIFYSRMLLKPILEKFNVVFYHNLNIPLLSDIDGVTEVKGIPSNFNLRHSDLTNNIVNCWIGQENMVYVKTDSPGCSFENYFKLVKKILDFYNIEIKTNKEFYLPSVNYNKITNILSLEKSISTLCKQYKKIILICNGNVNSGQSINIDLSETIKKLAVNNPTHLFLITSQFSHNQHNIVDTSSLTNVIPDLLEISYISTFCDIIVGRASGPYCFTHTIDNLLNKNKTYISFCANPNEGIWYKESKANQIWSNNFDLNNIFTIINKEIN